MLKSIDEVIESFTVEHVAKVTADKAKSDTKYILARQANSYALASSILFGLAHAFAEPIRHCRPEEGLIVGAATAMVLYIDRTLGISLTQQLEQSENDIYEERREQARANRLVELALGATLGAFGIYGLLDHTVNSTAISSIPFAGITIAHALSIYYRFAPSSLMIKEAVPEPA